MSMLDRIIENSEKVTIPNDIEFTGQFVATGFQSEPGGIAYYVHNGTGKNDYDGKSAATPAPSITKALSLCRASKGDTIHCLPGHIETVATAGGLTFNKAGIRVFFHGRGNTKATIQFTATAATLLITAANVELYSPRFLAGIDAIVAAINPQAADFKMYDVEYYDAAAKATLIQVLTTSAADRLVIDGYKYFVSTTGTQKTDGIKTVGGDSIVLKDIDINGDFSTSNINVSTAATKLTLENINVNNVNATPKPAITLHANTTGFAKNVKARVASGTTYVSSVAKLQWADDCEGFNTDGYGGEPIGTPIATGIEGKLDSVLSDIIDVWSDVKSVISDLTGDVWSDLKSVISDLVDVVSDLTDIRSDIVTVQSDLGDVASDLLITHSDVKAMNTRTITIASDLVITQSDVKDISGDVNNVKSDLIITQSDVKVIDTRVATVRSDLIITQSDIKSMNTRQITIASDLVIVQSDVSDVGSDLLDIRSDIVVVQSDLGDVWSDIVIIQSDVKVIDARVKVTNSDMIITHSDVKAMNTRTITIASDLVITHSDVKTINSDLIVADALIDTIKSDLIISQSDLKIVDRNKDYIATVDLVAANMTGTATRFTIANGPILVKHLGAITTTNIPAGANTLLFAFTPTGQAQANLCGATDTASANTPQLFTVDGVKVTVLQKVTDIGIMVAANETAMPLILSEGVISTVFSAGPPATGGLKLYMQYQKLNPAATVT